MKKKPSYVKISTRELSKLKQMVRPDLKTRNDKLFKVLVNNINKNALKG